MRVVGTGQPGECAAWHERGVAEIDLARGREVGRHRNIEQAAFPATYLHRRHTAERGRDMPILVHNAHTSGPLGDEGTIHRTHVYSHLTGRPATE